MEFFFIGEPELLTAFRFVGVNGIGVYKAEEARAAFLMITQGVDETAGMNPSISNITNIERDSCRVLILTEEVGGWLGDRLTDWQLSGEYPLVVEIPGILGRLEGHKSLVDSIREAVGLHV